MVKGKTIGVDATTLEANAALRSIVRRDSGESYEESLTKLAKASGVGYQTVVFQNSFWLLDPQVASGQVIQGARVSSSLFPQLGL